MHWQFRCSIVLSYLAQELETGEKVDIKIFGVISYSNGQRLLLIHSAAVDKGANAIATMIWATVHAIKTSGTPAANARIAFFQFDGAGENINKCVNFTQSHCVAHLWFCLF